MRGLVAMSQAPLLTLGVFVVWIIGSLDVILAQHRGQPPYLWFGSRLQNPFDWTSALHPAFYWASISVLSVLVSASSLFSIAYSDPTAGILNLAGLSIFLLNCTPNPFVSAQHRYADDSQRIALATTHHEGTMYILPSEGNGIDAVWCPKIRNEHLEADGEIMTLFQHMRADRWAMSEPLERLRETMARYHERLSVSTAQAERLAAWIYGDERAEPVVRRIECLRTANVHLIGRDLMFALCHAEYIVFMAQGRLPSEIRDKLGALRLMRRSGAAATGGGSETIGYRPGFDGYKEAVEHVYAIFKIAVDDSAISFTTAPPNFSYALSKSPASIDEYVAELWDLSTRHSESTFSGLYFFTTVWSMEVGNANGFHIFPLRCRSRDGDFVGQQIAWRQAWWAGCVSDLVSVSPVLFGSFVAGFMSFIGAWKKMKAWLQVR